MTHGFSDILSIIYEIEMILDAVILILSLGVLVMSLIRGIRFIKRQIRLFQLKKLY